MVTARSRGSVNGINKVYGFKTGVNGLLIDASKKKKTNKPHSSNRNLIEFDRVQ